MQLENYRCPECKHFGFLFTFACSGSTFSTDVDGYVCVMCDWCHWVGGAEDLMVKKNDKFILSDE